VLSEKDRSIEFPLSSFSPRSAVRRPFVRLHCMVTVSNSLRCLSVCLFILSVFCRSFLCRVGACLAVNVSGRFRLEVRSNARLSGFSLYSQFQIVYSVHLSDCLSLAVFCRSFLRKVAKRLPVNLSDRFRRKVWSNDRLSDFAKRL
jgi:hypothetical protein